MLLIAYLHHATGYANPLQEVYAELHYVPVLIGALAFGLRGAALVSVLICVIYVPYAVKVSTGTWFSLASHSIHILFPAFFGLLVGFLVDLERKRRLEVEKNRYLAGLGQAGAALVHDLRNPLTIIHWYTERIEEGEGDAQVAARKINEAAARIGQITDSVLDFARPITLRRKEEDLAGFVRELCEKEKTRAEEHGVSLIATGAQESIKVFIDPDFMQRAMINLITNAIDASKPGQNITISTNRARHGVVVKVTDRGKGMDRETLSNVFVPFYSKKTKGTGLGMAIAKKVIEDHGGRIEVSSQPGTGTEISITLPARWS
jgi:signal transduction histidine kinase